MNLIQSIRSNCRLSMFPNRLTAALVVVLLVAMAFGPAIAPAQTTWYVDDDAPGDPGPGDPGVSDPLEDGSADHPFDAIQEGIDVSVDGDTVLVLDGRYTGLGNKDLDFEGRLISVRSENGADKCIIDCEDDGRGFYFDTFETGDAVVEGFTITNGAADAGAGIYCQSGEPTIRYCTLTRNNAYSYMGIRGGGGGMYIHDESTVTHCTISRNTSNWGGGGILSGGAATIADCTISENTSSAGGGIAFSGIPTINNCVIIDNVAEASGGGVVFAGCYGVPHILMPTMTNCFVAGNTSREDGAGIAIRGSRPTISNCVIVGNVTEEGVGGAIRSNDNESLIITNCTIAGNHASQGRALACDSRLSQDPSTVEITNCVLWDGEDEVWNNDGSTISITFSDVQGGWPGDGNIDADPGFAFADDPRFLPGSACIDAGTNAPSAGLPTGDLDGNPRSLDGDGDGIIVVDMGAYEFDPDAPAIARSPLSLTAVAYVGGPPEIRTVSIRNSGVGVLEWEIVPRCSWVQVSPSSGQSTGEIDEVVVTIDAGGLARGFHIGTLELVAAGAVNSPHTVEVRLQAWSGYPTIQSLIDAADDGDTVVVQDGVYTGPGNKDLDFQGKAITLRSAGGSENCIIDCEGVGRGFEFHNGETLASVLDGFTIENGGAILCTNASSPTITNCAIVNGRPLVCLEGSSPLITHCLIAHNTGSGDYGGGIHAEGSPTISHCVITHNSSWQGGGIQWWYPGAPTISDCIITDNRAEFGAGICGNSGGATIRRCTIARNTAPLYSGLGGGVLLEGGGGTISECVITENSALLGGGIASFQSDWTISNCVITENEGEIDGGGILISQGSPTVTNCAITGNTAGYRGGGGISCSATDATIANCTIAANSAGAWGGGAVVGNGSAVRITNCVLWANAAGKGPEMAVMADDDPVVPSGLTASYCDVAGGKAAVYVDGFSSLFWGDGNLDVDPLFVDPENGDYGLTAGSPCIDSGCNCGVPPDTLDLDDDGDIDECTPFDLDGEGRFFDDPDTPDSGSGLPPIVDMGAYEFGGSDASPCLGDLDGDRDVDVADLAILLANYRTMSGASGADGDMDCDGDVDLSDLAALLPRYGSVCP